LSRKARNPSKGHRRKMFRLKGKLWPRPKKSAPTAASGERTEAYMIWGEKTRLAQAKRKGISPKNRKGERKENRKLPA